MDNLSSKFPMRSFVQFIIVDSFPVQLGVEVYCVKAAIYTRVSTDMQAEEGFSLIAQLSRLRHYCESQGWIVSDVYTDDGYSAKDMNRPGLKSLLDDVKNRKMNVVLVYKLDRLTRSVRDLDDLLTEFDRYEVSFKSATEVYDTTTATGRLFLHLVASLAQWERETIAERTRFGQEQMTLQGRWSGGHAPFGYANKDGQLVIHDQQADVIRGIFSRYTSGEGNTKILRWLNNPESPQLAPNGRWTQGALKYVLRNPLYAGYVRYGYRSVQGRKQPNHIIKEGIHEAIIDADMWELTQKIIRQRQVFPSRSSEGTYPLSGILRCGKCGAAMSGRTHYRTSKSVDKEPNRHYICNERQHSGLCDLPMFQQSRVENVLLEYLEGYHVVPEVDEQSTRIAEVSKAKEQIQQEIRDLKRTHTRWMDAYEHEDITSTELHSRLDPIREKLQVLDDRLDDLQDSVSIDPEFLKGVLQSFRFTWQAADSSDRKALISTIIERIDIYPDGKAPSRRPIPFRLQVTFRT